MCFRVLQQTKRLNIKMPQMFATGRGIKTIENFKIIWHPKQSFWFLMRGDHSQETPAVVIQLRKFSCFFFGCLWEVVTNERTGTKWRLDSESTVYYMYHWWSIPDSVTVVVSETDHDALGKWFHYCVLLRLYLKKYSVFKLWLWVYFK